AREVERKSKQEAEEFSQAAKATGPPGFLERIRDEEDDTQRYFGDEDTKRQDTNTGTVADAFREEFDIVYKTFKLILKSWAQAPGAITRITWMDLVANSLLDSGRIIITEANRLWNYYVGLPVPPRAWEIHFPQRDEL
ncbi:hypothetical protein KEM56_002505, partial [Ascosphaera pollenicola]